MLLGFGRGLFQKVKRSISPKEYGANGSDDTAAINTALSVAAAKGWVCVIDGYFVASGAITIPASTTVLGAGGSITTTSSITVQNNAVVDGLVASNPLTGFHALLTFPTGSSGQIIKNCHLTSGTPITIYTSSNYEIKENTLVSNGGYPIYASGSTDGHIHHNTITCNGGYGIQLTHHLSSNLIEYNNVDGTHTAKTGIILLNEYNGNVFDNVIQNNTVYNQDEEGISVDHWTPAQFEVTSYAGVGTIELSSTVVIGQSVMVMTGDHAGEYARISANNGGGVYALDDNHLLGSFTNETVAVQYLARRTTIQNNIVSGTGRDGIMMYGGQAGTIVTGNTVDNCGIAPDVVSPSFGWVPYPFAGISALVVSRQIDTKKYDSVIGDITITGNSVTNSTPPINVGVANWGGSMQYSPVKVFVA